MKFHSKFHQWMLANVPQSPQAQEAQCTVYAPKLQEAFPEELEVRKGVVYSWANVDNYSPSKPKKYPHMWCIVRATDEILDPTANQFFLLGELVYEEAPREVTSMGKCMNCGDYFYNRPLAYTCSEPCEKELMNYHNNL